MMADDSSEQQASANPRAPLDGLIVADLSRVLAGPYCSMLLADLGATVIKVESPAGDDTRTWMPPENGGVATYYQSINRNKRSIVLDFGDADDLALAHELLRRADIAIENFRPGSLAKFGLDYPPCGAAQPPADLPVDHRLRHRRRRVAARLRPRRPSGLRADEPHR